MKNLFKLFLTLCVVVIASNALYSAEPQTHKGSTAIYWGFGGLSELSIDNSTLGVQYLFAERTGIWAELSLSMLNSKQNKDDDDGIANNNTGFYTGVIFYVLQNEPVALYVSPQIGIGMMSEENKDASATFKDSQTTFSIGASIGAEWWFAKNVSLSASTFIGYEGTTYTAERGDNKAESASSSIGILPTVGANFLISFYFN